MQTKYGNVRDELLKEYVEQRLVNKIFKLLPLREENNPTLKECHESLMLELNGAGKLVAKLQDDADFMSLLCSLESLNSIDDIKVYRRKIFESISTLKKIANNI